MHGYRFPPGVTVRTESPGDGSSITIENSIDVNECMASVICNSEEIKTVDQANSYTVESVRQWLHVSQFGTNILLSFGFREFCLECRTTG